MTPLTVTMLALFTALLASGQTFAKPDTRPTIGWIENVTLADVGIVQKARIDTGAGLASIDATILDVRKPEKDGQLETVIFEVKDPKGEPKRLERPVVKWINIKRKGTEGFIKRPVVKLDFCLGGKRVEGRANLADRTGFLYPALIGRNILKAGDFMIDPEKTFTHGAACPKPKKKAL